MVDTLDTVRTVAVGVTGQHVCLFGLPDIVSIFVGIATFIYLVIKIRRELVEKRKGDSNSR